jgi:hypothetical protein
VRRAGVLLSAALLGTAIGVTASAFSGQTSNAGNSFQAASSFGGCPSAPTPVWLTGLEHGQVSTSGGGLFDALNGSPTADSTVKRNGTYSLKLAPAGTVQKATKNLPAGQSVVVARFAVRLASIPSGSSELFLTQAGGSAAIFEYDATAGKFATRFVFGGSAIGSAPSAGSWHLIDMKVNVGTNPRTIDWRVDGVAQPQASYSTAAATTTAVEFGAPNARTYTANYDDMIVSQTAADYPIGDGKVLALRPNAMGTHNTPANFQNNDGTAIDANTYTRLDDDPMTSSVDYVKQVTALSTSYVELGFADTVESCFNGVSGVLAYHSAGTAANNGKASIFDGTAERTIFSGDMSESSLFYKSAVITPAASPWTQSAVNGLIGRVGYSTDVNPEPFWDALLLEYDVPG